MVEAGGKVRWGIIGCGDVTERKSGPALARATNSELVAVMRRDAEKASDYARRHHIPKWYITVEELLQDEHVDAVYVATPPGSHLEIALKVAAAGKPCYMEKPMARNFTESRQMVEAFAQAGLPLFVAYYRRAYPSYVKLRKLLCSGALGELSSICYTMRRKDVEGAGANMWDPASPISKPSRRRRRSTVGNWREHVPASGGGLFVDVGSNVLNLFEFLLGPLRAVRGVAARDPASAADAPEDVVAVSFLAGNAIVGSASWNFRAFDEYELLEIVGSSGRATLPEPMNGSVCEISYADGTVESWEEPPPFPCVQEPLIQSAVDAILASDPSRCPSTAESAMQTSQHVDAALQDFYAGRQDAFWDRPLTWEPSAVA